MKKSLSILILWALAALCAFAIPARPGKFQYTQPDGSVVTLELHGDEFLHWATNEQGTVVALDKAGFWRPSAITEQQIQEAEALRSQANRMRAEAREAMSRVADGNVMTRGQRHIPALLVAFKDKPFSLSDPKTMFENLLNQPGYSYDGGTGSVRDFYLDNSHGVFEPIFDVYGPYTVSNNMSYYGNRDTDASKAILEAARALDSEIDFSRYDVDNDGSVDMLLMFYAGYNEAEGAPEATIWPHQSSINSSTRFDGKTLGRYFCTSELKGTRGTTMCGIGTTTHEFGHSLGLPDFYDTNYNTNGRAGGLYAFSTMCSGSYNNSSRTPPRFNAEERIMLNWMTEDDLTELSAGYTDIPTIQTDKGYKISTDVEGEYFILETRDGTSWDEPLPKGLLVYHVDKSKIHSVGGITAYNHWAHWEWYNKINAFGDHPCFYIIPAGNPSSLNYSGGANRIVFPGSANVTSYIPVTWDQHDQGIMLDKITYANGVTSVLLRDPDVEPDDSIKTLHQMNYNSIDPGKGIYEAGDVFQLKIIEADEDKPTKVVWAYDGVTVTGSITLEKGEHTLSATLSYADGRTEIIEMLFDIKDEGEHGI